MAQTFSAQIDAFVAKTKRRISAVLKQSTQDVIELAQTPVAKGGHMPVDTGFLRSSLQSSLLGGTSLSGPESYVLLAVGFEPGMVAEFGWTANYARHVEYGTRGRPGRHFVGNAAAQWDAIVQKNAARAKVAITT